MEVGNFVKQDRGDGEPTYGRIVAKQKNRSFRAVVWETWRPNRAHMASLLGWYPRPVVVPIGDVPAKAVMVMKRHLEAIKARRDHGSD